MANERKFVQENIRRLLLKEYVMKKVKRAGFGGIDIQRTPMGTRITLITERPGFVIGRKGVAIKDLTEAVQYNFKFDNPQIEVQEVENASLNAQIMAEKLASSLERGWHFRRAGHSTVRRIMEAGAKGCQVIISGKLTGERHRTEKYKDGHIKFCGEPKAQWIHQGYAVAKLKAGVIGVTVQIMDPMAKLPDEIEVRIPSPEGEKEAEKEKEEKKEGTKTQEKRENRSRSRDGGRRERKPRRPRRMGGGSRRKDGQKQGEKKPDDRSSGEHKQKEVKENENVKKSEKQTEKVEKETAENIDKKKSEKESVGGAEMEKPEEQTEENVKDADKKKEEIKEDSNGTETS